MELILRVPSGAGIQPIQLSVGTPLLASRLKTSIASRAPWPTM